jgi:hypothetical protein
VEQLNRRSLMKLFGVGATIVPIIGGAIEETAAAKLIEVPKIDLVSEKEPVVSFAVRRMRLSLDVDFTDKREFDALKYLYANQVGVACKLNAVVSGLNATFKTHSPIDAEINLYAVHGSPSVVTFGAVKVTK